MLDFLFNIGIYHYLFLFMVVFLIGLSGVIFSRNLVRIVMSIFIMILSVVLNFVVFAYYCDNSFYKSNIMCVFVLLIFVLQTIISLVILYKIYQANRFLDSEKTKDKED